MEATDMNAVARVNRKNDALERINLAGSGWMDAKSRASHVPAMPEDETYAARYHRVFSKKGS